MEVISGSFRLLSPEREPCEVADSPERLGSFPDTDPFDPRLAVLAVLEPQRRVGPAGGGAYTGLLGGVLF